MDMAMDILNETENIFNHEFDEFARTFSVHERGACGAGRVALLV